MLSDMLLLSAMRWPVALRDPVRFCLFRTWGSFLVEPERSFFKIPQLSLLEAAAASVAAARTTVLSYVPVCWLLVAGRFIRRLCISDNCPSSEVMESAWGRCTLGIPGKGYADDEIRDICERLD